MADMNPQLQNDARWQLIERIAASTSFQKSNRLRDLLFFIAEQSLTDETLRLGEHQIGTVVFGKSQDYSAVEDSSVRVHVRQLRLRLYEYFQSEGHDETWTVEIPKGSYNAVFRNSAQASAAVRAGLDRRRWLKLLRLLPWALAALFLVTTCVALLRNPRTATLASPPWPLSQLFDAGNDPVQIVVADANYGILQLFKDQPTTLSEYLSPRFWDTETRAKAQLTFRETRVAGYLSISTLTSFADATVSASLVRLAGSAAGRITINSARNLHPRDLEKGNFIFLGGPRSNPWVSTFQEKLNFTDYINPDDPGSNCFHNLHPRPGEQETYCPIRSAVTSPVYYSTISLVPLPDGNGNALILRGLQEQGTEAMGRFLADPAKRKELQQALGLTGTPKQPIYFEALILTKSIGNTPTATSSIVATRTIHP
jgi:hypothetical protein